MGTMGGGDMKGGGFGRGSRDENMQGGNMQFPERPQEQIQNETDENAENKEMPQMPEEVPNSGDGEVPKRPEDMNQSENTEISEDTPAANMNQMQPGNKDTKSEDSFPTKNQFEGQRPDMKNGFWLSALTQYSMTDLIMISISLILVIGALIFVKAYKRNIGYNTRERIFTCLQG